MLWILNRSTKIVDGTLEDHLAEFEVDDSKAADAAEFVEELSRKSDE